MDIVLKGKTGIAKKLDLGDHSKNSSTVDFGQIADGGKKEQTQQGTLQIFSTHVVCLACVSQFCGGCAMIPSRPLPY